MYKNKAADGWNNICGKKISALRLQMQSKVSQRALADLMQLKGIDLDKNAIQWIECGKRFVTDIELKAFAQILHVTTDELLRDDDE